jgi:hypothetical protein
MRYTHILVGVLVAGTIAAALPSVNATGASLPIDGLKVVAETDTGDDTTLAQWHRERGERRERRERFERGERGERRENRGERRERREDRGERREGWRRGWWGHTATISSVASLPSPQIDLKE